MTLRRIFTEADARQMALLYEAGWPMSRIGKEFHCHRTTVSFYLHTIGVETKPPGGVKVPRLPHSEFERIRFMAVYEGLSTRQIAHRTGLTVSQVQYRLRASGFRRSRSQSSKQGYEYRRLKARVRELERAA